MSFVGSQTMCQSGVIPVVLLDVIKRVPPLPRIKTETLNHSSPSVYKIRFDVQQMPIKLGRLACNAVSARKRRLLCLTSIRVFDTAPITFGSRLRFLALMDWYESQRKCLTPAAEARAYISVGALVASHRFRQALWTAKVFPLPSVNRGQEGEQQA